MTADRSYAFTSDAEPTLRPRQPTDGQLLPVLTTRAVAAAAAPDGTLPLAIEGEQIAARVVGVVERFPSVEGRRRGRRPGAAATAARHGRRPGSGRPTSSGSSGSLPRAPESSRSQSRAETLADLRADPLARGALATLAGDRAVALAPRARRALLGVVGDRRDERGELFDLEAQGAAPATIRTRTCASRARLVAGFGVRPAGSCGSDPLDARPLARHA